MHEFQSKRAYSANSSKNPFLNDSFETALTRASRNIYELKDLLQRNKTNNKYPLKKQFIRNEKEYTKEINTKLLRVAKIIDRIPHPKMNKPKQQKSNSKKNCVLPIIKIKRTQSSSFIKKQIYFDNLLTKLESEIKEIFYKKDNNILCSNNSNQINNFISGCSKYKKLQTIYKYINDSETAIKFHYMIIDFTPKHINDQVQPNPEYKFIKIKTESFFVVKVFLDVLQLIIKYFYMIYDNDSLFIRDNYGSISTYCNRLKKKYEIYKNELNELVENYSVVSKGLLINNNVYNQYVYELCDYSNSILKEENKFFNAIHKIININNN